MALIDQQPMLHRSVNWLHVRCNMFVESFSVEFQECVDSALKFNCCAGHFKLSSNFNFPGKGKRGSQKRAV